jgi:hypothetical protein
LFLARPLLAFKRDLSRPTSETRVPNDQDFLSTNRTRQESTSSSSPLEIIDIDTSGSFKSIFDKVKNTLSPSTKRRTSENPNNNNNDDERKNSSGENRNSSISSLSNKNSEKPRLHHHKSVSFADNIENDFDSDNINHQYSVDDQYEIVRNAQTLADQILNASISEATTKTKAISNNNTNDDDIEFQREFHQTIKQRRILNDNKEDLVYQDLSAEIVAYILKHALRTLKKEQEQLIRPTNNNNEEDDFIDLK